ncbi:MAG: GTP 3',8-cyclase MoaA [Cytophagaceae bacterium]|nr:GTP 3',8-cyclase MoaA [Cytophagaceae bacterium]
MLVDSFGRLHNYLRISLTDRCNFRCLYCMPDESYTFMPAENLMSAREIVQLAGIFVKLGVNKIRLTGGEPTIRKDFELILCGLSELNTELLLTTNGATLHKHISVLKKCGLCSVNVSLDTLDEKRFTNITKRNSFHTVWNNIMLCLEHDIRVKINVVAIRGCIESELLNFVALTKNLPIHVRFIEYMPFSGNQWDKQKVITAAEMLHRIQSEYDCIKLCDEPHATAKKYKVVGYTGSFAFITTMSNAFCNSCNRLRLTADGKIKNCLFGKDEINLLDALRRGEDVAALIQLSVQKKHAALGGQVHSTYTDIQPENIINRSMISIGG